MSLVDLFIKIEQRETSRWDFDYYSDVVFPSPLLPSKLEENIHMPLFNLHFPLYIIFTEELTKMEFNSQGRDVRPFI